jgi:heat shock protein HslJ
MTRAQAMRKLLALLLIVAAPASAQAVDPALTATTWRVVELLGAPVPYPVTLQFADHSVSGRGPCNRFSAGFKQSNESVEIGQPVATRMFCQGRMDAEKQYFDMLHAAHRYRIADGVLSLNSADGSTLIKLAK